jgi:hypothetical protein
MALFDTNSGLGNLFSGMNIFGARQPEYLGGLLSPEELQKVQNQSLLQGVLGSAATYLAQPKNQGYGSALPYLGKAYLGGMQSSQGAYDQATQNLLTRGKLEEFKREAETAKLTREAQQELLNDPRVQANPTLKALASKGDFSKVADVINPKPAENDYDRYSFAYKDKAFKDLTAPEKQDIIKQVQADKKDQATQINLGSPVAGVDAQGQPVFFQPSKAGGQAVIVPGIKPLQEPKAPTESQAKAQTFYSQMTNASDELKQLQKEGFDPSSPIAQTAVNLAGTPLRGIAGQQAQRAKQIQEQWAESFLRIKTGAAATKDEVRKNVETFFPRFGETDPSIIAQKERARAQAEQDVLAMTKPGNVGQKPKELSAQDKQALDWANSNATDPRAAQIKQRLGL